MVGGKSDRFFDYVRFEQAASGLDQGHRYLLAENLDSYSGNFPSESGLIVGNEPPKTLIHDLALEFEISEDEILNMIQAAPRLKMAVRGWVAEKHLGNLIQLTPGIDNFRQIEEDGKPDFEVIYQESAPIFIECKNALRIPLADGTTKVDFQKTRASKNDPCTRFYSRSDFQILAACLHPRTEKWEFSFCPTSTLKPHKHCEGKLSNLVRVDEAWNIDLASVLETIAA
ncbi:MAG: hypothetical protein P1V20_01390 [Verrucomicrobiales bacterium]|nr:hypothetical protein [Verrucomicrobiales bacterium]